MTDQMPPDVGTDEPRDDSVLVGEYVLGLLTPSEAETLERRLPQDAALRALLAEWTDTMAPMLEGADETPPPRLRAAIEERLFEAKAEPRRWPMWLGFLVTPLAALAVVFLLINPGEDFDPTLHVDIEVPGIGLSMAAGADEDTLRIITLAGMPEPGRAYELWLIDPEGTPVSIGLLPNSGAIDIPRPEGLATGVVFAISDEPAGGSPTGAPTGPVLAAEPLFDI